MPNADHRATRSVVEIYLGPDDPRITPLKELENSAPLPHLGAVLGRSGRQKLAYFTRQGVKGNKYVVCYIDTADRLRYGDRITLECQTPEELLQQLTAHEMLQGGV